MADASIAAFPQVMPGESRELTAAYPHQLNPNRAKPQIVFE
jgi:hypothetical protein